MPDSRLITIAIHTFDRAVRLRTILESEGIPVTFQNVNLDTPSVSAGIRLRIAEEDLPRALRLLESIQIISPDVAEKFPADGPSILVPIDFSAYTSTVTAIAFSFAAMHKARIVFLHTYLDPGLMDTSAMQLSDSLTFPSTLTQQVEMEESKEEARIAEEQMKRFKERLDSMIASGSLPDVRFETQVSEGLPEEAIEECNKRLHPILTVMGTNSADEKSRALNGSIAGEVLNQADSTILTIPGGKNLDLSAPVQAAFFSTSRQDDILAIDTFARLFPKGGINVTLIDLPSRRSKSSDGIGHLLDYCNENYPAFTFSTASIHAENPEKDFDEINSRQNINLIVVPNRRKNVIARIFSPTLAHRLLFSAPLPILAISLD